MTRTTRCTTHHGQRVDSQVREAQFIEMTPGLAEWLLGMNTHNRKVKPSVVDKYAKRITDGEFVATNQGIGIVANDGNPWLGDGQHRILAWIKAGQPEGVMFLIVTGLESESQVFVDAGANRRMSDMLTLLLDRSMSKHVVAVATKMMAIQPRIVSKQSSGEGGFVLNSSMARLISPYQLAEFIDTRLAHHAELLGRCARLRSSVTAAIVEFADRWSADDAMEFACQVVEGELLKKGDPAYRLREWMAKNSRNNMDAEWYSRTVSACCAHARRQSIASLFAATAWSLPQRRLTPCGYQ